MQNRAQMKESKCAKDILKCENEKCRSEKQQQKAVWSSIDVSAYALLAVVILFWYQKN